MYCLSEAQIEFILNDIRARGVELESLQMDLLDHVCCLIEQSFEGDSDFEAFYYTTIRTFYKDELKEIEAETLFLLNNKNYYAMKKVMLFSGIFSAIVLCFGILFKFMHWPGAGVLIVSGIALFSLLFLPLLFTLKVREKQKAIDRFIIAVGTLSAIGFSLSTLFKVMHWPGANIMGISAIGIMLLIFLPVYFFTGIKSSETKVNTMVTSILIIAGAGLLMSLVRSPGNSATINRLNTENFLRNEQLLMNEQKQLALYLKKGNIAAPVTFESQEVYDQCEKIKSYILALETGYKTLPAAYEKKHILIPDGWIKDHFKENTAPASHLQALRAQVEKYNAANAQNPVFKPIKIERTVLDRTEERTLAALNNLNQVQMQVLQNEILAAFAQN